MAKRAVNGAGTVYRERALWHGRIEVDGLLHEVAEPTRNKAAAELDRLAQGGTVAEVLSLTKVGRDRWVGQTYVSGKRRKVTAGTHAEVEAKLDELAGIANEARSCPMGTQRSPTSRHAGDECRLELIGRRRRSIKTSGRLGFSSREFDSVRLRSLTVARVEEGISHIADGGYGRELSKLSARRVLAMLRRVLDYGERIELIGRNPANRLDAATFGHKRESTTGALTAEQATKLYEAAGDHWIGGYVRLGLVIGARPSELAALCWDAVNLDTGRIEIRRSRRQVGPGRYEVVDDLKTSRSRRAIELPPFAIEQLREQRTKVAEAQRAEPSWPHPELVFPSPAGTLLDTSDVRHDLKRICADAGVPTVGPNALRHSVASLLAHDGESPARVAQLLGHATPATTWRYYTHNVTDSADAAAGMGEMLGQ